MQILPFDGNQKFWLPVTPDNSDIEILVSGWIHYAESKAFSPYINYHLTLEVPNKVNPNLYSATIIVSKHNNVEFIVDRVMHIGYVAPQIPGYVTPKFRRVIYSVISKRIDCIGL